MGEEEWKDIGSLISNQVNSSADVYIKIQNRFHDVFIRQQSILEPFVKEYIEAFSNTGKDLYSAFSHINEITSHFQEVLDFSAISDNLQSISISPEVWERHEREESQYIKRLACIGWPFLLDVPVSFISQFNEEYEKNRTAEFVHEFEIAICDFYSADSMENIFKRWSRFDLLKSRIKILKDVISSHINRNYTLSIPDLLPQIEGILSQYYITNPKFEKRSVIIYIDHLLEGNDRYLPFKGIIIDNLYEKFRWGNEILPSLSRHAILHGADTNYATEINSLKIILIFDLIINMLTNNS